jgi:uncharacterized membrane protein (UPF0136 family)
MMLGQVVLLVYAILLIVGGLAGSRAGSKVSLIAGSTSSLALLVALLVSLWSPAVGFWIGAAISLVLCGVFGSRLAQTRKMMPAGMLLILSLVALVVLAFAARRVSAKTSEPAIEVMPAVVELATDDTNA